MKALMALPNTLTVAYLWPNQYCAQVANRTAWRLLDSQVARQALRIIYLQITALLSVPRAQPLSCCVRGPKFALESYHMRHCLLPLLQELDVTLYIYSSSKKQRPDLVEWHFDTLQESFVLLMLGRNA